MTGNLYHHIHNLALLAMPFAKRPLLFGGLLSGGILLFSGSCYVVGLSEDRSYGKLAPVGGFMFMAGWLAFAFWMHRSWMSGFLGKIIIVLFFFVSLSPYSLERKCQYIHHFSQGECHFVCLIMHLMIILTILFKSFAKLEMGKLKRQNKTTATTKRFFQLEINANTCSKIFVPTVWQKDRTTTITNWAPSILHSLCDMQVV